jgi:hypothetical protein
MDDRGDAAVAPHGLKAPRSDGCFHPGAGSARAGPCQNDLADAKTLFSQRHQIDARHDDVAAELLGRYLPVTAPDSDERQVLGLNERHLTLRIAASGMVIAGDPLTDLDLRLDERFDRGFTPGGAADPFHPANLRDFSQQMLHIGHRGTTEDERLASYRSGTARSRTGGIRFGWPHRCPLSERGRKLATVCQLLKVSR